MNQFCWKYNDKWNPTEIVGNIKNQQRSFYQEFRGETSLHEELIKMSKLENAIEDADEFHFQ
jgi:hypothetical protein